LYERKNEKKKCVLCLFVGKCGNGVESKKRFGERKGAAKGKEMRKQRNNIILTKSINTTNQMFLPFISLFPYP
jgi:hypothetical protein